MPSFFLSLCFLHGFVSSPVEFLLPLYFFLFVFPLQVSSCTPNGLASCLLSFSFFLPLLPALFVPTLLRWSPEPPPLLHLPPSQTHFPPRPTSLEGVCSKQPGVAEGEDRIRQGPTVRSRPAPPSETLDESLPSFEGQRLDAYHFPLQGLHCLSLGEQGRSCPPGTDGGEFCSWCHEAVSRARRGLIQKPLSKESSTHAPTPSCRLQPVTSDQSHHSRKEERGRFGKGPFMRAKSKGSLSHALA